MSYVVVKFEDDGKVCAVPASWLIGENVHLPPTFDKNMRMAITHAMSPRDTWKEYAATCILRGLTYGMAVAYAKKFSNHNEDSDANPCESVGHRREPGPVVHSALISPGAGPSSVPAVEYPVMQTNSLSGSVSNALNLSVAEEKATSQPSFPHRKGYGQAILAAIQSFKDDIKSDMKDIVTRIENLESRVAALDEKMSKYHSNVLRKAGNQSPVQPRWHPWFPLRTITDLYTMERNLQNENCRAEVVHFVQWTPAGNISDRTKCCLARMVSNDLSRHLSWQKTPNKYPFGTTSLWALILETLSASYSDQETSALLIRKICVAWFQNARDRGGGRYKRRFTCPNMPLLEKNDENISGGGN